MRHFRLINNWVPLNGTWTFCLVNAWGGHGFLGFGVLNFAIEWSRDGFTNIKVPR